MSRFLNLINEHIKEYDEKAEAIDPIFDKDDELLEISAALRALVALRAEYLGWED